MRVSLVAAGVFLALAGCCPTRAAQAPAPLAGNDAGHVGPSGPDALPDPEAMMSRGDRALAEGRFSEALKLYLWCLDFGAEVDRSFVGLQGTEVPPRIVRLGKSHPAAITALRVRQARAEENMAAGRRTNPTLYVLVNDALGDRERSFETYARLLKALPASSEALEGMSLMLIGDLVDRGQHDQVVRFSTVVERYLRISLDAIAKAPVGSVERKRSVIAGASAAVPGAELYCALAKVRKTQSAHQVAELVLRLDPSAEMAAHLLSLDASCGDAGDKSWLSGIIGKILSSDENALLEIARQRDGL